MSKRTDIIEGLQILEKYDQNGDCDAQHDVIYASPPVNVSEADAKRLDLLGFFEDDDGWQVFT